MESSFSRKSDGSVSSVNINEILNEVLELVRYKSHYDKIEIQTDQRLYISVDGLTPITQKRTPCAWSSAKTSSKRLDLSSVTAFQNESAS